MNQYIARFTRWSEQYTGTDMTYLTHGSFWLSSSQVVTAASSFLLAFAFAHLLPKESFGTYEYILTIFGVLTLACLRGMDGLVVQALARGKEGTFWQGLYAKMGWGLLGSLASIVTAFYYYHKGNATLGIAFIAAALFIPLMDPFGLYGSILAAKKDFKLSSLLHVGSQVIAALALIVAMIINHNPVFIFVTYCFTWTLTRLAALIVSLKKFPLNQETERDALSYGWHSSLIAGSAALLASLDSILIYHYLGPANLAVYTFAMAPVLQIRTFLNILGTLAVPKFAAKASQEIRQTLFPRSMVLTAIGIVIAFAYSLLAYPLFHYIFPRYIDSLRYSQVFSLTIAIGLGGLLISAVADARTTLIPKQLLYLWNLPSIILALSAIFLIKFFGIWGAIVGQILSMATGGILGIFLWRLIRDKDFT